MQNNLVHEQLSKEFYDKIHEMKGVNIDLREIRQIINGNFGIVIIIDDVSEQLNEIVNILSQDGAEVITVPFETYIDSKSNCLHRFTTFTKEALEKESKKWSFKWTIIPVEKHLNKTNSDLKNVFSYLSKKICSLPNVKEKSRREWITYQTSPLKNFCTVKFLPDHLEVYIKCDDSFKDNKNITKKINRTASWTFDRMMTVRSYKEVENIMDFIKQSYQCTCIKIK